MVTNTLVLDSSAVSEPQMVSTMILVIIEASIIL